MVPARIAISSREIVLEHAYARDVSGPPVVNVFLKGYSWIGQLGCCMTIPSLFERSTAVGTATGWVTEE